MFFTSNHRCKAPVLPLPQVRRGRDERLAEPAKEAGKGRRVVDAPRHVAPEVVPTMKMDMTADSLSFQPVAAEVFKCRLKPPSHPLFFVNDNPRLILTSTRRIVLAKARSRKTTIRLLELTSGRKLENNWHESLKFKQTFLWKEMYGVVM